MRRYMTLLVALAFLLFAMGVMAQATRHSNQQTTTTTTTTTSQPSATRGATEHTIEGCLAREGSDFFLIPSRGNPFELQASAGQDLSAHEGQKVRVRGTESALSASNVSRNGGGTAGAATTTTTTSANGTNTTSRSITSPAGQSASANTGAATGTGNDLHRLASREMNVASVQRVAATCPVNWNPRVSSRSKSSKY